MWKKETVENASAVEKPERAGRGKGQFRKRSAAAGIFRRDVCPPLIPPPLKNAFFGRLIPYVPNVEGNFTTEMDDLGRKGKKRRRKNDFRRRRKEEGRPASGCRQEAQIFPSAPAPELAVSF